LVVRAAHVVHIQSAALIIGVQERPSTAALDKQTWNNNNNNNNK
jgi:hypothetical protein